jgi:D-xylose 1-dehydrogenase
MTDDSARYPSLAGKRVVVTGGGSGIGAGLVEAFARQGAETIFVDILEQESAALVLFLASDDGRMCTGHEYWIDAGWR